jgi:aminoglycoside 6'-N-acetyltransferase-1b/aminoglycoside 6'-N-acetyltransferase-2
MLGEEPIGYAQSYVALGSGDGWWEDETDPGVRGIDQSLANPTQLNQGLGTRLVRALVERLFSDPTVTTIQTYAPCQPSMGATVEWRFMVPHAQDNA